MMSLMIIDRDPKYSEWLRHHLSTVYDETKLRVLAFDEFERTNATLTYNDVDLLLLTAKFGEYPEDPNSEGLALLRAYRNRAAFPAVLIIAEEGNELTAVRALQLGALDYLPKKLLTPDRLKSSVRLALRRVERRVARRHAKQSHTGEHAETHEMQNEGHAPALQPDLIPGYAIRSVIGESEKAIVYLAASASLDKDIALKVTLAESDSEQHELLAREYDAIATLRHPAIVELYDYGVHGGREYLAMEYFPRGDLKARMYNGISEGEALRLVENIASALRVVHHAGILHRDLKPPNVMLREDDDVALIDFGLARHLEGSLRLTRTGVLRGSPYYMSPEQALGEKLDARSDLYSLGIMFFEMLTGRKPFAGSSAIEVLQQHVNAPLPKLPERYAHYEPLIEKLLAKSAEQRFASAEQVLEAITTLRQGALTSAAEPTAA